MVLLGDEAQKELILVCLEIVLLLRQDRCMLLLRQDSSFWRHPMVLLGDEAQMKARFRPFRDSVNLNIR
jgi:hypothetical protein